jgi:hypothetical protein
LESGAVFGFFNIAKNLQLTYSGPLQMKKHKEDANITTTNVYNILQNYNFHRAIKDSRIKFPL